MIKTYTPNEIKKIRNMLRLSQAQFARMVGVASDRTVRRWEEGEKEIPGCVNIIMHLLEESPESARILLQLAG